MKTGLILIAIFTLASPLMLSAATEENPSMQTRPLVLDRPETIISDRAANYIDRLPDERVKVWIFFNSKGVNDQAAFDEAAARLTISDKALARRTRVGRDEVVYADLPVVDEYVTGIVERGGNLRRVSRWLNAASFELDRSSLETIAALPFVYRIQPLAVFKRDNDSVKVEPDPGVNRLQPESPDALSYGMSAGQLEMINVPAAHDRGYNGEGVIVAMLDTGFRKSHVAFSQAYADGRVLAEYDFVFDDDEVQNEPEDWSSQHNHGTYIWSTLGGFSPGHVIGPAYGASYLLAKTEDVRSETQVEEDNWVAALEWADSLGAEVLSSSLGYSDWYSYFDLDGATTVITVAANTAADLGIICTISMGNDGSSSGSLTAPADAYNILACGAVAANETIAGFSSRGPTYDGRTKPEVCAQGVDTYCAAGGGDDSYSYVDGTSLSTPLVGGVAALVLSANPTYTPAIIRRAMMETADRAATPDNDYGHGIIDALAAAEWGVNFTADTIIGTESLTVAFADISDLDATTWQWSFGDGDFSTEPNPNHHYDTPGNYSVSLGISTEYGRMEKIKEKLIAVIADTLTIVSDSAYAGGEVTISVNLKNTQDLNDILIPIDYASDLELDLTAVERGERTDYFETVSTPFWDQNSRKIVIQLVSSASGELPPLPPGDGEILELTFTIPETTPSGAAGELSVVDIYYYTLKVANSMVEYIPEVNSGQVGTIHVARGDANNDTIINILDVVYLITYKYKYGPAPVTLAAGDADADGKIDILDITYLINYKYKGGPPPLD